MCKRTHSLQGITQTKECIARFEEIYGTSLELEKQQDRYEALIKSHYESYEKYDFLETHIFSTAGRTELGGNHTDHNLGKVIAASIDLDTIAVASSIQESKVILISPGFSDVVVDISNLDVVDSEKNTTDSLVRGIAHAFRERALQVGGLIIHTTTNVLKGSGLSSSAAIEVLIATIFNSMFNDDVLDPVELAIIGQYAENVYFGKPSGLMDQIACSVGNVVKIDFLNPKKPMVTSIQFDFKKSGYQLMIIDTKGDHADLGEEYAAIPHEMKMVASFFGKSVLREVSLEEFICSIQAIKATMNNDRAILRAYHYLLENERVDNMHKALLDNDIALYLELVKASGASSLHFLQNIYTPHHPLVQPISIALMMCEQLLKSDGAARIHGGGFAGTVQVYVPVSLVSQFVNKIQQVFGPSSVTPLTIRKVSTTRFDIF